MGKEFGKRRILGTRFSLKFMISMPRTILISRIKYDWIVLILRRQVTRIMYSRCLSSKENPESSKQSQIATTLTPPITQKACVKSAIVSVAEKQKPQSASILKGCAMRGVSATSATAVGITRSPENKINRFLRIMAPSSDGDILT